MKRFMYLGVAALIASTLLPEGQVFAQKSQSLPQVPITYPGDANETIVRRAQWMERAKKEGAVVWWGVFRPQHAEQIAAEFNKLYPFIKIEYWAGSTGPEIAAKLEAELASGKTPADILLGGDPLNYPRWRKAGYLDKFTEIIPEIKKLDERMFSRYGDWAIPGAIVTAPQYNTKLVATAEAPKSWDDLLNPKWKGQMGLMTDAKGWYVLALGEGGWGLKKTEEFLRKLKQQNPIWQRTHIAATTLLGTGEFKIYAAGYVHNLFQVKDKGAPIDFCRVNPVIITGSSITLQKNAIHPNASRLFLEWLFSPQGLAFYEKVTSSGAVYPGARTRVGRAVEGLSFIYRTEEVELKAFEMGLDEKLKDILGVAPK